MSKLQKQEELDIFTKFRSINSDKTFDGEVVSFDKPDILVKLGNSTTGIEISRITYKKHPDSKFCILEKSNFEKGIIEEAEKLFLDQSPHKLLVDISFKDNVKMTEKARRNLSEALATLIINNTQNLSNNQRFFLNHGLPKEIKSINIYFYSRNTQSLWQVGDGMLLQNLSAEQVLKTIERKNNSTSDYRQHINNKLILLLVEGYSEHEMFYRIASINKNELSSDFDNIYLLRYFANEIITIK